MRAGGRVLRAAPLGSATAPATTSALRPAGELRIVRLGALASLRLEDGPKQTSRENGKRQVVVQANVRERDVGFFVAEASEPKVA